MAAHHCTGIPCAICNSIPTDEGPRLIPFAVKLEPRPAPVQRMDICKACGAHTEITRAGSLLMILRAGEGCGCCAIKLGDDEL